MQVQPQGPTSGPRLRIPPQGPTLESSLRDPTQGPTLGPHPRVPSQGPTLGFHLRAPPQGPTLGSHFRVLPQGPGSHFSGMLKVAGLLKKTATLLKKRLRHKCFPVSFAKFLRAFFLTEQLRWLLLNLQQIFYYFRTSSRSEVFREIVAQKIFGKSLETHELHSAIPVEFHSLNFSCSFCKNVPDIFLAIFQEVAFWRCF